FSWFFQQYGVRDVDDRNNPAPVAPSTSPKTSVDDDFRTQDIVGTRFQPRARLWSGNDLLLGWDLEQSWICSTRFRGGLNAAPLSQVAAAENESSSSVQSYYFEDAQAFFGDRVVMRGGMRWTQGTTNIEATPNQPNLVPNSRDYDAMTYSAGGT